MQWFLSLPLLAQVVLLVYGASIAALAAIYLYEEHYALACPCQGMDPEHDHFALRKPFSKNAQCVACGFEFSIA